MLFLRSKKRTEFPYRQSGRRRRSDPAKPVGSGRRRNRVGVSDELFAKMKARAAEQGKSLADVLEEAIGNSFD